MLFERWGYIQGGKRNNENRRAPVVAARPCRREFQNLKPFFKAEAEKHRLVLPSSDTDFTMPLIGTADGTSLSNGISSEKVAPFHPVRRGVGPRTVMAPPLTGVHSYIEEAGCSYTRLSSWQAPPSTLNSAPSFLS